FAYTPCLVPLTSPFFFSSRRRHTRSKRDWSSDVCSSDLRPYGWASRWEELISVQRAVADAEGVQTRQMGAQTLLELLPALLRGAPRPLGERAHPREGHVLHLCGRGHVLRPHLTLQAHQQLLLLLVEGVRGEGRGVDVLDGGEPADRERFVLRGGLVVVEVGVLVVRDDGAEAAGGRLLQ